MATGPVTSAAGSRPRPQGMSLRRDAAVLLPAVLVLVMAMVLAVFDGGYTKTVWYPIALFLLALLVLVLVLAPPERSARAGRWFDLATLAFGAYTLWSFASILWAATPGDAWEGANRTLLYWIGFTIVGLRPWPPGAARGALALVALGVGALAVGLLIDSAVREDATALLVQGRVSEPFGYSNATANYWLIAFFPALHLAIGRDSPWPVRGLFLAVAVLLLDMAMLSQSRGAVLAFGVVAVLFVVLHPRHWTALLALLVPVVFVAIGWDQLIEVRNARSLGELESALSGAREYVAISVVVTLVLGTAAAFADAAVRRRVQPSARRARAAELGFLGIAGSLAVASLVVLAFSGGWIDERWDDFRTTSYDQVEAGETRLTGSLGSGRYDFYRVSFNEFRAHPVGGIGAENFAVPYLQQRRTGEAPRYPHSLAFSILAMLGIVGAILFVAFLAVTLAGFARVRLRGTPPEQGLAVGALGGFLAWLVHAQVDWLWEYPALTLLALGLLAVSMRIDDPARLPGTRTPGRLMRSLPARAALGLLVLVGAVSLALPGAAARYERSAYAAQQTDRAATLSRLKRASELDRLTADPLLARALLLRREGRIDEARADLQEALDREPENWFAHFELGLLEGSERRWDPAETSVARAAELNPGQPLIADVRKMIARRRTIDPSAIERELDQQLSVRLKPFELK